MKNAPVASLMHHNKVFLFQSDVRSHLYTPERHRFGETVCRARRNASLI